MLSERELQQRTLVRVPDVVGLPLRKAVLLVEQAGLRLGATLYKESYEEKDTVLEQKPRRGQMVYASEDVSIWVSRESYIKWLPAIYQRSDSTGRNIVRDLLWLVQHMFGSIESQLDNIHLIFNSYETRREFLPWLAAWSAMVLEPDWPENKKRRLIKKAMELYRWRGTVKGLGLFISLFTGFEPHLQENVWPYQGLRIGVSSTVGIDTVILPPVDKSHAFMVVMPYQFKDVTPEAIIRLHEIIEMEKPAHAHYMLKFEEPQQAVEEREFYRIGVTSGINIGEEVVTPLPVNAETGEIELPKEPVMPAPVPEPSVYELFGTRKRQLPPIEGAPKADNAPVEGKEIRSSKFGFEGAREFKLDDIMRELLERAGVAVEATAEKPAADTTPEGLKPLGQTQSPSAPTRTLADLDLDGTLAKMEAKHKPSEPEGQKPSEPAAEQQGSEPEAARTLFNMETVRLSGAVSTEPAAGRPGLRGPHGPKVEVEVVVEEKEGAESEATDKHGTAQPPENESKK